MTQPTSIRNRFDRSLQPIRSQSRIRNSRFRRPRLETLEQRYVLAAAIWDGGGPDLNWSTPENWIGNQIPASGDEVTIDDARSIEVVYDIEEPLSIASLNLSESLKLTAGGLTVSGSTVIDANRNLTVDGASFLAQSTTTFDTTSLFVSNGGVLRLLGATSYTNTNTNNADRYLRASGVGSVLSLPNLTSLTGVRDPYDEVRVEALNGGVV
ncbi:hypothetical protein, partial [Roseiconus lacunae]|uniref:hypothetical protein n=2 Tax=Roseiconus lacunae TaxID=2605694 RepID=UPI0011F2B9ED